MLREVVPIIGSANLGAKNLHIWCTLNHFVDSPACRSYESIAHHFDLALGTSAFMRKVLPNTSTLLVLISGNTTHHLNRAPAIVSSFFLLCLIIILTTLNFIRLYYVYSHEVNLFISFNISYHILSTPWFV